MITQRKVTIYLSDSGPSTKKYHSLAAACMHEAFYKLKAVYLKAMTQEEFEEFIKTPEFMVERKNVAHVLRAEYRVQIQIAKATA